MRAAGAGVVRRRALGHVLGRGEAGKGEGEAMSGQAHGAISVQSEAVGEPALDQEAGDRALAAPA